MFIIFYVMCFCAVGGVIDGSSIHNINGERLTWDPPEFPQGMIIRYEVLVNESGQIFTTPTNEIDINSFGLPPGMYSVQVAMRACITVMTHTRMHTQTNTCVY